MNTGFVERGGPSALLGKLPEKATPREGGHEGPLHEYPRVTRQPKEVTREESAQQK